MTSKDKWTWMPHPAHFICADNCRFHLATEVGGYIVSTVGEYWPDSRVRRIYVESRGVEIKGRGDEWDANYFKKFGYEEIGAGIKYETMVFKSKKHSSKDKDYLCCKFEIANADSLDFLGYNTATEAYKGHMKLCARWAKKK